MHVSLGVEPRMSLQGDEGCKACITEIADEGSEGGVSLQMLKWKIFHCQDNTNIFVLLVTCW